MHTGPGCRTCGYWGSVEGRAGAGRCRWFPPLRPAGGLEEGDPRSESGPGWFCGEYSHLHRVHAGSLPLDAYLDEFST